VENKPVARWSPLRWRIDDYLMAETEIHQPSRYALRPEETRWIEAWQEFIQHLDPDRLPGFPIWVDAFHSIEDRDPSTPAWKASFIRKNKELYAEHSAWIDKWYERRGLDQFPPSRRKFEWQARGSAPLLWNLVIHLRPSGIRVKAPTYLPALVAITQTSIIGARQRRITPREAARLQGFPDTFVLAEDDATAYRQLGNAVNVGVVRYVVQALIEASRISEAEQLELVS
jgi:DNA (cytosine-5)-methyltransferase 1